MQPGDLTTLANLKAWLFAGTGNLPPSTDDAMLARLISAVSRYVLSYLDRPPLYSRVYTEAYNGTGGNRLYLTKWPVTAISSLAVDGVAITPTITPPLGAGFMFDPWDPQDQAGGPQQIVVNGWGFVRGQMNVRVQYTAGYLVSSEMQTIPAAAPNRLQVNMTWAADGGVTFVAGGAALTPITGGAVPAAGQYSVQEGVYLFSPADSSKAIAITYSFTPPDLEQAVIELIGERYRGRNRIGEMSHSTGGSVTVSFSQKDMHDNIKTLLKIFRRTAPIGL